MTKKRTILFVCLGNTCRSPMAQHIAKAITKNDIIATSCGIEVTSKQMNTKAIQVLKQKLLIDISNNVPIKITDIDLHVFDTIYSLDKEVTTYLQKSKVIKGNVVELLFEDPYNQGQEKYFDTYDEIYKQLLKIENEQGSI